MTEKKASDLSGFNGAHTVHAYLISASGIAAARDYAVTLAAALMCENSTESGDACGVCSACRKVYGGVHPDVSVIGKDKVSVEDVRELRTKAYLAPNEGKRKVFVLERVENFNLPSQNALLKILEEPPKDVAFVLTALSENGILATVLSRVNVLTPPGVSEEFCRREAEKIVGAGGDPEKIERIASYLALYEDTDASNFPAELTEAAFALAFGYYKGTETAIVPQLPKKKEEMLVYFRVFMLVARNVAVYKLSRGKCRVTPFTEDFRRLSAKMSAKRALQYYELFEKAYLLAEDYANTNALYAFLTEKL